MGEEEERGRKGKGEDRGGENRGGKKEEERRKDERRGGKGWAGWRDGDGSVGCKRQAHFLRNKVRTWSDLIFPAC